MYWHQLSVTPFPETSSPTLLWGNCSTISTCHMVHKIPAGSMHIHSILKMYCSKHCMFDPTGDSIQGQWYVSKCTTADWMSRQLLHTAAVQQANDTNLNSNWIESFQIYHKTNGFQSFNALPSMANWPESKHGGPLGTVPKTCFDSRPTAALHCRRHKRRALVWNRHNATGWLASTIQSAAAICNWQTKGTRTTGAECPSWVTEQHPHITVRCTGGSRAAK